MKFKSKSKNVKKLKFPATKVVIWWQPKLAPSAKFREVSAADVLYLSILICFLALFFASEFTWCCVLPLQQTNIKLKIFSA
jgi:hypothetical protein